MEPRKRDIGTGTPFLAKAPAASVSITPATVTRPTTNATAMPPRSSHRDPAPRGRTVVNPVTTR